MDRGLTAAPTAPTFSAMVRCCAAIATGGVLGVLLLAVAAAAWSEFVDRPLVKCP